MRSNDRKLANNIIIKGNNFFSNLIPFKEYVGKLEIIKIDGIMIAPMIEKGIEVILGAKIDPVFGPFIMFGLGGIYAEAIKDVAFVEAPANKKMVVEMIKRLKSSKIFEGDRGVKINYDLLVDTIVKLSNFIYAHKDHVKEIDMNPVIVNEKNVIGLDALIINY